MSTERRDMHRVVLWGKWALLNIKLKFRGSLGRDIIKYLVII